MNFKAPHKETRESVTNWDNNLFLMGVTALYFWDAPKRATIKDTSMGHQPVAG
jgi:hypothetical protein